MLLFGASLSECMEDNTTEVEKKTTFIHVEPPVKLGETLRTKKYVSRSCYTLWLSLSVAFAAGVWCNYEMVLLPAECVLDGSDDDGDDADADGDAELSIFSLKGYSILLWDRNSVIQLRSAGIKFTVVIRFPNFSNIIRL